jgi:hypothetical protein
MQLNNCKILYKDEDFISRGGFGTVYKGEMILNL